MVHNELEQKLGEITKNVENFSKEIKKKLIDLGKETYNDLIKKACSEESALIGARIIIDNAYLLLLGCYLEEVSVGRVLELGNLLVYKQLPKNLKQEVLSFARNVESIVEGQQIYDEKKRLGLIRGIAELYSEYLQRNQKPELQNELPPDPPQK